MELTRPNHLAWARTEHYDDMHLSCVAADLSKMIGYSVSANTLRLMEKGQVLPTNQLWQELARFYHESPALLQRPMIADEIPEMARLGDRIFFLREINNESQAQLAKKLNLPLSDLRCYEIGTTEIPMSVVVKVAEHYHVSLDYLAGVEPEEAR